MAIDVQPSGVGSSDEPVRQGMDSGVPLWESFKAALAPVASLRLTVALFAVSIVLIFAGTLAQVDKDIWEVIGQYFRCWFAWIPFQVFAPPSFIVAYEIRDASDKLIDTTYSFMGLFPLGHWKATDIPGGFYFPGGKLIGLLLAGNLLAAHIIRFKAEARGKRLAAGIGAIAAGVAMTWYIIASGGNSKGIQAEPFVPYHTLWIGFKGLLALLGLGAAYVTTLLWMPPQKGGPVSNAWFLRGLMIAITGGLAFVTGWLVINGDAVRPSDSSLRILWQLTQSTFAGIALLAGCWVVFKRRAGIVLLHAGVGLMMYYELHVALTAVETQLNLAEGETSNYVHDIRTYELAIIDKTDPKEDRVVTIPRSMLVAGQSIDLKELPFIVDIARVEKNSHLRAASSKDENPATTGIGVEWFAEAKRPGSGTDSDSKVDMAAAYVTLKSRSDGKPLSTHLVAMLLSMSDETDSIRVGDQTFELALRPKRYYKDYRFTLKDVRKEDYIGTSTPRNYASTVAILDKSRNVDEEKTIWMNNPLRFADETFYQSSYHRGQDGVEHTTLSVVANSGWMMPYVSCMLVAIGMLAHFLIVLFRFLTRTDGAIVSDEQAAAAANLKEKLGIKSDNSTSRGASSKSVSPQKTSGRASVIAAALIALLTVGYIGSKARAPKVNPFDYDLAAFGRIPVVQDGRVKPLDTAARTALLEISGRTSVSLEDPDAPPVSSFMKMLGKTKPDKKKVPAIKWLLDVIAENEAAENYEIFRIENLEVQEVVGVKKRDGMRYSRAELRAKQAEFQKQVELAREVARKDRRQLSVYQRKVLELSDKLSTFDNIQFAFGLQHRIRGETAEEVIQSFQAAIRFEKMIVEQGQPILAVGADDKQQPWRTLAGAWLDNTMKTIRDKKEPDPNVVAWEALLKAYSKNDAKDFNREVESYLNQLYAKPHPDVNPARVKFEAFFNRFQPFTLAAVLNVFAFILVASGWFGWTKGFNRCAFWLQVVILALHTFALIGRIYISGRPPVTNLYSSAVFVGWACVVLGLTLELVYRLGIGSLVAAVAGYGTLLIADGQSLSGDTFTVLQAVLDTQFWLATHVTCITFGYATTYLAGLLGIVYVLRGVLTKSLDRSVSRDLTRMIYGTLCFSIFFSFVGTVLGGLWADDSWGRFWGWDPKENGALIIVLWNALALHARWGGMVKERGLAVLAIAGNIFVSWSWWGVNELGAGLHAYGFTEGTIRNLGICVLVHLALIGIGLLPNRYWRSHPKSEGDSAALA